MKTMLDKYHLTIPRNTAEPGGGAAPAAGATPAVAPAAGAGTPAAPAAGGTPAAAPAPAAPAATQPYRPAGLPETMYGDDDRQTMDKMAKALEGYRARDSAAIPEDPKAYAAFDMAKVDEKLRPHIAELSNDPMMADIAAVAREEKIPVASLQKLITAYYAGADKAGFLDQTFDPKAEREALLPESAKSLPKADQDKAIDARMQANIDYLNLQVKNGVGADGKPIAGALTQADADYAQAMLGDSAAGNRFLEWVASMTGGGGKPQPLAGNGSTATGLSQREQLRAEMALPQNTVGNPAFSKASYDALMLKYQQLPRA